MDHPNSAASRYPTWNTERLARAVLQIESVIKEQDQKRQDGRAHFQLYRDVAWVHSPKGEKLQGGFFLKKDQVSGSHGPRGGHTR